MSTWELVQTLKGHGGWIATAYFSPDGRRILTTSYDGSLRVYFVQTMDLVNLAKMRVTRELTCAERVEYLHELAGRATPTPTRTPTR